MSRQRKKLLPSSQLLITTLGLIGATLILEGVSLIGFSGPQSTLAIFLAGNALAIFPASIAFICALVGFFRFSRYRILNIFLAILAFCINPATLGFILINGL